MPKKTNQPAPSEPTPSPDLPQSNPPPHVTSPHTIPHILPRLHRRRREQLPHHLLPRTMAAPSAPGHRLLPPVLTTGGVPPHLCSRLENFALRASRLPARARRLARLPASKPLSRQCCSSLLPRLDRPPPRASPSSLLRQRPRPERRHQRVPTPAPFPTSASRDRSPPAESRRAAAPLR